jgi:hypothetical protein
MLRKSMRDMFARSWMQQGRFLTTWRRSTSMLHTGLRQAHWTFLELLLMVQIISSSGCMLVALYSDVSFYSIVA